MPKKCLSGFTLAELLIALSILGIIATFTISKLLQNQQASKFNTIAKEAASTISGAYQAYKLNNTVSASTGVSNLVPYLNYVSVQTTGNIDGDAGTPTISCDATGNCFRLHNGALLRLALNNTFGGTQPNRNITAIVDPDGQYTEKADSLILVLYANGKITTHFYRQSGDLSNFGGSDVDYGQGGPDPSWFSW